MKYAFTLNGHKWNQKEVLCIFKCVIVKLAQIADTFELPSRARHEPAPHNT